MTGSANSTWQSTCMPFCSQPVTSIVCGNAYTYSIQLRSRTRLGSCYLGEEVRSCIGRVIDDELPTCRRVHDRRTAVRSAVTCRACSCIAAWVGRPGVVVENEIRLQLLATEADLGDSAVHHHVFHTRNDRRTDSETASG